MTKTFSLPWITVAAGFLGVAEIPGSKNNKQILEFLKTVIDTETEETPWCSAFVNYVLAKAGYKGTGSAMARSFENWKSGTKLSTYKPGAIVTRYRGKKSSGLGHVGFAVAKKPGYTAFLGGNQGDKVSVVWLDDGHITGYFWPKASPFEVQLTPDEEKLFAKLASSGETKLV